MRAPIAAAVVLALLGGCSSSRSSVNSTGDAALDGPGDVAASADVGDAASLGCGGVFVCLGPCEDASCEAACVAKGTAAAQATIRALIDCVEAACPRSGGGVCDQSAPSFDANACAACFQAAQEAAGACAVQVATCKADP